jgi:hypothetical protein
LHAVVKAQFRFLCLMHEIRPVVVGLPCRYPYKIHNYNHFFLDTRHTIAALIRGVTPSTTIDTLSWYLFFYLFHLRQWTGGRVCRLSCIFVIESIVLILFSQCSSFFLSCMVSYVFVHSFCRISFSLQRMKTLP